jgi:LuxR family maltose regulon positive regulatory protein
MRTWNMPTDRLATLLCLGRLQLCQGNFTSAHETVQQAKELRASQPVFLDLSRSLDMLEIRLALAERDIPIAAHLMDSLQPGTSRIVFLREQELVLLARLRLAEGQPDEALDILEALANEAESGGRYFAWLEALIQQALALEAKGERESALEVLGRALVFAKTEGFVRVFVDEGDTMQQLLAAMLRKGSSAASDYIAKLLEAFRAGKEPQAAPQAPKTLDGLIEPLTKRELEVLQLIAAGDSNQVIAQKLVITVSAVKKHSGNIFGKLNVNSRTQAVRCARQLGLLPTDK